MLTMAFLISIQVSHANPNTLCSNNPVYTLNQLLNITPHECTALTGKKLSFTQVVKLKLTQQLFKKLVLKGKDLDDEPKSQIISLLLCTLVGFLGIHRFYLGYTAIGIIQALTFGGCLIWWICDIILIITGSLKPADGSEYYPTFSDI